MAYLNIERLSPIARVVLIYVFNKYGRTAVNTTKLCKFERSELMIINNEEDCPYCEVVPYRYGNEYMESYCCTIDNKECLRSKCPIISGKPFTTTESLD